MRPSSLLTVLSLLALVACQTPRPGPLPTLVPTQASGVVATMVVPGSSTATPAPPPTVTASPTPTPVPVILTVCQTEEPTSLALYGAESPARAAILDALYDGPIDTLNYALQPVILETLPNVNSGGATFKAVTVNPGDQVVDALTFQTLVLTTGVRLAQMDGSWLVYSGTAPATTVQVTADFKLRSDIKWSDGEPLTAADSVLGFELARQQRNIVALRTASYTTLDNFIVQWTGLPGWYDTAYATRFWNPVPRHRYGSFTLTQLQSDEEANRQPLTWGPFVVQNWVAGESLTLTRNPYYFRASEGFPRVDGVVFRFGLSAEQVLVELQAGRCDIGAESVDFTALLAQLKDNTGVGLYTTPSPTLQTLVFGMASAEDYKRPAGKELFQDLRFRQALTLCLDRQILIDTWLAGQTAVPNTYAPANYPAFATDAPVYSLDVPRAQALLDELEWVDRDGDGLRERGRQKLALTLAIEADDSFQHQLAEQIQSQLQTNCGVAITIEASSPDNLYAPWPDGVLFGRQFDLALIAWRAGSELPCELYTTSAIPGDQNPGGANASAYSNPAFDEACRAAQLSLEDTERRLAQRQTQSLLAADLPMVPLFFYPRIGLTHPKVVGYQLDSTARSDLWNLEAISLAQP